MWNVQIPKTLWAAIIPLRLHKTYSEEDHLFENKKESPHSNQSKRIIKRHINKSQPYIGYNLAYLNRNTFISRKVVQNHKLWLLIWPKYCRKVLVEKIAFKNKQSWWNALFAVIKIWFYHLLAVDKDRQ